MNTQILSKDSISAALEHLEIQPLSYSLFFWHENEEVRPRYLQHSRILILVKGALRLSTPFCCYSIQDMDCIILPHETFCSLTVLKPSEAICIDFTASYNASYKRLDSLIHFSTPQFYPHLFDERQIQNLLHLNTTIRENYPGTWILIRAMILRIFLVAMVYRNKHGISVGLPNGTKHNEEVLKDCVLYIEKHLNEPTRIQDLAEHLNYSPNYIYKTFEKTLGVSPKMFIQQYKLDRATYLLKTTNKPIQQIASELGFCSVFHFSSCFKKQFQMSPTAWRNMSGLSE